jgi:16S rRNA processing protein RimM
MSAWVRLGVVGRPHGVRGALKVHLDNPKSTALRAGVVVRLVQGPSQREYAVRACGGGVLSIADVVDRDAAQALVHAVIEVPRASLGPETLLVDLLGCAVVDVAGAPLGRLERFHDNGAQPVAEIAVAGGSTVLVPFVPPLVVSSGPPVVLAPPAGLFDDAQALVAGSAEDVDVVDAQDAGDG